VFKMDLRRQIVVAFELIQNLKVCGVRGHGLKVTKHSPLENDVHVM
jgi:hypothetical protein